MDSLTHIVLGGALAQVCLGQRPNRPALGRWAWLPAAAGATLPDLDIFLRTGDAVLDHALHRQYTHALLLAPLLGALAGLVFLLHRRWRGQWRQVLLAAALGRATHGLLDACTAYGTALWWPFSARRIAWDWIAVVDPIFTLLLLAGLVLAVWKNHPRLAGVGLLLATLYLGFGALQHEHAAAVQHELAARRAQTITRGRVMPTLGNLLAWRSVYESDGRLYADALRLPPWGAPKVKLGETLPVAHRPQAEPALGAAAQRDLDCFWSFADGYVAQVPLESRSDPASLWGDMRYSGLPSKFRPFWGVEIQGDQVLWRQVGGGLAFWRLWADLRGRGGYVRLEQVPLQP